MVGEWCAWSDKRPTPLVEGYPRDGPFYDSVSSKRARSLALSPWPMPTHDDVQRFKLMSSLCQPLALKAIDLAWSGSGVHGVTKGRHYQSKVILVTVHVATWFLCVGSYAVVQMSYLSGVGLAPADSFTFLVSLVVGGGACYWLASGSSQMRWHVSCGRVSHVSRLCAQAPNCAHTINS